MSQSQSRPMATKLEALMKRRRAQLRLGPAKPLHTQVALEDFLKSVGIALRYHSTDAIPLASVYQAVWGGAPEELDQNAARPAIELTHRLLAAKTAVETNAVAERVCLVHRAVVPALGKLARAGSPENVTELGDLARRAFELLLSGPRSIGDLRRALRVHAEPKNDPLYEALAELQRSFRVDRGPASVPAKGIPYLSPEGYPWRPFHLAHPDLEREAVALSTEEAALRVLSIYIRGAAFGTRRKLASMFRRLMTGPQLERALASLVDRGDVDAMAVPRDTAYVWRTA